MRHDPPKGYPVSSFCTNCGNDFAADWLFDLHRIGVHEYTYSEGLNFNPPLEDGRRCMTEEEMLNANMRPMTEDEKKATMRHNLRSGFNVALWFNPDETHRARAAFGRPRLLKSRVDAS